MAGQHPASSSSQRPVRVDAAQSVAKICVGCNVDVGAMPRVKDEAGRYWCKPCLARAEAEAQRAESAPDETRFGDDGGGFDDIDLAAAAQAEARAEALQIELPKEIRCPGCKGELAKESRICIKCGYDKARRGQVTTRVERAPVARAERPATVGSSNVASHVLYAVGLALVAGNLASPWLGLLGVPFVLAHSVFMTGTFVTSIVFAYIDRAMVAALSGTLVMLAVVGTLVLALVMAANGGARVAAGAPASGAVGGDSASYAAGYFIGSLVMLTVIIVGCVAPILYGMRQHRAWLQAMAVCSALSIACSITLFLLMAAGVVPALGR